MEQSFWEERWASRQIGFHLPAPNRMLVAHGSFLDGQRRVYVPLCGKSLDLVFLRDRGHDVIGCEFVRQAVLEFFDELREPPRTESRPPFTAYAADRLTLLEGDAFAVTPAHCGGQVDAIYDRASLVAVAPAQRERLVDSFRWLLAPGGRLLLIAFEYDQAKVSGPPWSIGAAEVERLFGAWATIRRLDEAVEPANPRMAASGVATVTEHVFGIEAR